MDPQVHKDPLDLRVLRGIWHKWRGLKTGESVHGIAVMVLIMES